MAVVVEETVKSMILVRPFVRILNRSRLYSYSIQNNHFSAMALSVEAPKCFELPINIPSKLLMGPGPSNAAESVLKVSSAPLLGHLHTEFIKVKPKCNLQNLF